jgi:hypothetical protein
MNKHLDQNYALYISGTGNRNRQRLGDRNKQRPRGTGIGTGTQTWKRNRQRPRGTETCKDLGKQKQAKTRWWTDAIQQIHLFFFLVLVININY